MASIASREYRKQCYLSSLEETKSYLNLVLAGIDAANLYSNSQEEAYLDSIYSSGKRIAENLQELINDRLGEDNDKICSGKC